MVYNSEYLKATELYSWNTLIIYVNLSWLNITKSGNTWEFVHIQAILAETKVLVGYPGADVEQLRSEAGTGNMAP